MKSSLVSFVVLVLLSPQQILDFSSDSMIQRTVTLAAPWFQVTAASFVIFKNGTELLNKKNKPDNSDDDFDP